MYKCLHLLFTNLLIGIAYFNYVFILLTYNSKQTELCSKALKISLNVDKFTVILLMAILSTGTFLVPMSDLTFKTPWINATYLLFACTSVLWLTNILLKKKSVNIRQSKIFHLISILIFVTLIAILRDAVTKHTWLSL